MCGCGGGGGGGLVVAKAISFQLKPSHTFHLESKEIERGRDGGVLEKGRVGVEWSSLARTTDVSNRLTGWAREGK